MKGKKIRLLKTSSHTLYSTRLAVELENQSKVSAIVMSHDQVIRINSIITTHVTALVGAMSLAGSESTEEEEFPDTSIAVAHVTGEV